MNEPVDLNGTLSIVNKNGVPAHFYSVGGLGSGECVGIAKQDDHWQTYFSERGSKTSVQYHTSEADACLSFLKNLNSLLKEYGIKTNFDSAPQTAEPAVRA